MDPNVQIVDSGEEITSEEQNPLAIFATSEAPFATVSMSLCLGSVLPSCFTVQSKFTALINAAPSKRVKIPSQAFTVSHLPFASSVSASAPSPSPSPSSKLSHRSTISANPLQNPLSLGPRRPMDPSNAAGIRRASVCWFRNDLRVQDNECLNSANNESMSVLNVYCFDPKDFGKSASGSGSHRASFVIEAVADLRKSLQARGSDLVVRIGKPETVLAELAKEVGAEAVYAHMEVSHDEVKREQKIEAAIKEEGIEMKYFWGSTLHHVEDLPFKLEDMPTNFGGFKGKAKGLEVRKTIVALEQLKGKPALGDVEVGEIPTLMDLGISQEGKSGVNPSMVGGESEAIHKIQTFAAECKTQTHKGTKDGKDTIYGANFSCKISPWLTNGCISPRTIFEELKKTATTSITAAFNNNEGNDGSSGAGTNWLMHELMWRDFFRFITKKYSSATKVNLAPVTA